MLSPSWTKTPIEGFEDFEFPSGNTLKFISIEDEEISAGKLALSKGDDATQSKSIKAS